VGDAPPGMGEGDKLIVFLDELSATKAVLRIARAYFSGNQADRSAISLAYPHIACGMSLGTMIMEPQRRPCYGSSQHLAWKRSPRERRCADVFLRGCRDLGVFFCGERAAAGGRHPEFCAARYSSQAR
jgi:hypothetical protein